MSNSEPKVVSKHTFLIPVNFFLKLQSPVEIALTRSKQPWDTFCIHGVVLSVDDLVIPLEQHTYVFFNIHLHDSENINHVFVQIKLFPGFVRELVSVLCLRNSRVHGIQDNVNNLHVGDPVGKLPVIPDELNEVFVDANFIAIQRILHIHFCMIVLAGELVFLQVVSFKVVFGSTEDQSDFLSSFFSGQCLPEFPIVISGSISAKEIGQIIVVLFFIALFDQSIELLSENDLLIRPELFSFKFTTGVQFLSPLNIRLSGSSSPYIAYSSTKRSLFLPLTLVDYSTTI